MKVRLSARKFNFFIFFFLVFFTGIYGGIYLNRNYQISSLKNFLYDKLRLNNYIKSFNANPENLELIINEKALSEINKNRKIAIANGVLSDDLKDYFKAKCIYRKDTFNVKFKMKGDFSDHWGGKKVSYRIKIKDNKLLNGMSAFSIQDPKTRYYIYEWIYQRFFDTENTINLNYYFFNVSINDENKGIYALEEFFTDELLKRNYKIKAPIIKISEDNLFYENNCTHCSDFNEVVDELYLKNDIECYNSKNLMKDSTQRVYFHNAKSLLSKFRSGELITSQVFDIKILSRIYAISDLLGGHHGLSWNNCRFYYNPKTNLLEMIPFDSNSGKFDPSITYTSLDHFYGSDGIYLFNRQIFDDPTFVSSYLSDLNMVSQTDFLDDFIKINKDDIDNQIKILCIDNYDFDYDIYTKISNRQVQLRQFLNEPKALSFKVNKKEQLEVGNKSSKPILISYIFNSDGQSLSIPPLILDPKKNFSVVTYQNIETTAPLINDEKLIFVYNIFGIKNNYKAQFKYHEI
tara:strand:- start:1890 stop:3443 length:1554 start_codon:yes stop_codon:yes gene_type:complete